MLDHAISYTGLSIATPPGGGEKFFKVIHALMFIESNFIHFPQFNIYSLSYLLHDKSKKFTNLGNANNIYSLWDKNSNVYNNIINNIMCAIIMI